MKQVFFLSIVPTFHLVSLIKKLAMYHVSLELERHRVLFLFHATHVHFYVFALLKLAMAAAAADADALYFNTAGEVCLTNEA